MNIVEIITIIFIIIILLVYFKKNKTEVDYITSDIDQRLYLVRNLPDKKEAANRLAKIRLMSIKLVDHISNKYNTEKTNRLKRKFNPNVISEGTDSDKYSTYSLNKGEKLVFCLRTRDNTNKLHDNNMLVFVAVHELGHIMTKTEGHNDEFKENFKFLLEEATKIGLYKPVNFREKPETYCGITVTDTPLSNEYFN